MYLIAAVIVIVSAPIYIYSHFVKVILYILNVDLK